MYTQQCNFTIGSLFDGSGGFPLAAYLCGGRPIWAAEVEPYPIAVTKSRFPKMIHLGDVSKINGADIPPVDVITFGSPCQDLSVAGKRAGLKHADNGDEETTRSGLFVEAIRIIKEMRERTNGIYPAFAVWENVPGAFSSNKGEDFRTVLEEFIKIKEPAATMPAVGKNGWAYADCIMGDQFSIAWRTFDAQYWGVPQRRRRIYLVADFAGQRAAKILFKREGLRRYFAQSGTQGQGIAADVERSTAADDCFGFPLGFRPENVRVYKETATTLCNGTRAGFTTGIIIKKQESAIPYTLKVRTGGEGGGKGALIQENKAATLAVTQDQYLFQPETAFLTDKEIYDVRITSNGTKNARAHCYKTAISRSLDTHEPNPDSNHGGVAIVQSVNAGDKSNTSSSIAAVDVRNSAENETAGALQARMSNSLSCNNTVRVNYIVRRLTPTECARLQGFPDNWGHPDKKETLTDAEYKFWLEVRNTHAAINGKTVKQYTKEQILKWYNSLHSDAAEYKMWGNGIALPNALYVMEGIAEELQAERK